MAQTPHALPTTLLHRSSVKQPTLAWSIHGFLTCIRPCPAAQWFCSIWFLKQFMFCINCWQHDPGRWGKMYQCNNATLEQLLRPSACKWNPISVSPLDFSLSLLDWTRLINRCGEKIMQMAGVESASTYDRASNGMKTPKSESCVTLLEMLFRVVVCFCACILLLRCFPHVMDQDGFGSHACPCQTHCVFRLHKSLPKWTKHTCCQATQI